MQRRTVLRSAAVGISGSLAGCHNQLLGAHSPAITPQWTLDIRGVDTVTTYLGWVFAQTSLDTPQIVALTPQDGSVVWSCDACRDFHVERDWLYIEEGRDRSTITAYEFPMTPEWQARGRFLQSRSDTVHLRRNVTTDQGSDHTVIDARDRGTGERRWQYPFEYWVTPFMTLHVDQDLYAVLDTQDESLAVRRIAEDGSTRRWQTQIGNGILPVSRYRDGVVYVGRERGDPSTTPGITAVTRDGSIKWERTWTVFHAFPEWVGDERLVALTRTLPNEPSVAGLDTATGATTWQADGLLVTVQHGVAIIYWDGLLRGVEIAGGRVRWRLDVTEFIDTGTDSTPDIDVEKGSIILADGSTIVGIDRDSRALDWRYDADTALDIAGVDAETVYAQSRNQLLALPRT